MVSTGFATILALLALPQALAPSTTVPQTIQQAFDAASRLSGGTDHQAALAAWEALERRVAGNPRSLAVVRVRKSAELAALGRLSEAGDAAKAGLAVLSPTDPSLRDDRYLATLRLAMIAKSALDYPTALARFREADAMAETPGDHLSALLGEIQTATFIDPPAALQAIAKADQAIAAVKLDKVSAADFSEAKSLYYLNTSNFAQAKAGAKDAVAQLGGLTEQTDLNDVAARSDYAIAALLSGDKDAARQYMAMTGAGRLPHGEFDPAAQLEVPPCGGDAGLKPDDMAVIQFSIADDGSVQQSEPIYAAGGGAVALAFARQALEWSWTPDQLKQMPPFFRYRARVELRCTRAFERPSLVDYLGAALDDWLAGKGVAPADDPEGSAADKVGGERAALAAVERKDGPASLAAVPALLTLAGNRVVTREETNALAHRAAAILAVHDAPPLARLRAELVVWATEDTERKNADRFRRALDDALAAGPYASDGRASAVLRLLRADAMDRQQAAAERIVLQQVADDRRLAQDDPLRAGAWIRLSSLDARDGNMAAAKVAFDRSGVHSDQCALIDATPKYIGSANGSQNFPMEAYAWGFEGWTQVQFDVAADGKVVNERALVSYPPFIFTDAGQKVMGTARYTKSYRPDGGLGCGASEQRVKFLLPNK